MKERERKFAAFDIDGTLFRSGLYREVAYELMKMGVLDEAVAAETTEKNREWRRRVHGNAFEEFEMLLVTKVDEALTNIRINDYETAVARVIAKKADNVYVYTRDLLQQLKSQGYFLIAISGSQVELVEPFAQKYGFDTWVGQEWERGNEFFTGNITKTHTGKDVILQRIIDEFDLSLTGSYAVGDSNGDVGMLSMAEHPIAFNPTRELFDVATKAGWEIVVERKNLHYSLQKGSHGSYVLAYPE